MQEPENHIYNNIQYIQVNTTNDIHSNDVTARQYLREPVHEDTSLSAFTPTFVLTTAKYKHKSKAQCL